MKNRPLLFAVLLAYLWLVSLAYESAESALLARLSTNWQKTPATVVQSSAAGPCSRSGGAVHKLVYSYSVGAAAYTGTRKSFGSAPCETEADAKRAVAQYPVGSALQVSVNSAHPHMSVVVAGQLSPQDYWQLVGLALALVVLPWGTWRYAHRAA